MKIARPELSESALWFLRESSYGRIRCTGSWGKDLFEALEVHKLIDIHGHITDAGRSVLKRAKMRFGPYGVI